MVPACLKMSYFSPRCMMRYPTLALIPNHMQLPCMQAALGYVSDQAEGFVDFDAVPDEGASAAEVLSFVLSPEARELRPLLIGWLAGAADLVLRDR